MQRGRIEILKHVSRVLQGNASGDPYERELPCYLPAGYDASQARYPVLYFLAGFTGFGKMMLNASAFDEPIDARLDRLIADGAMPPVILVLPDCITRFGGSQYANSSATGRYEDYIIDELVPFVDERLRTKSSRDHRGVTGKSSGGYGALRLAMRHPDVFGGLGSHAGDAYFDYCYYLDFPKFVLGIQKYGGTVESFYERFLALPKKSVAFDVLNILAMSACYSPNPDAPLGFDPPVDLRTGELREDVWRRWLDNDPVRMAPRHADALRSLKTIFIDAGLQDEFQLQLGARILCTRLDAVGARYIYEEFDDGHMGIVYRYDRSLVELAKALA
ncbi:MAG: esterase [Candidatus Eremiobacteraeota bacterium]|nr:esterase [Candidatus Eremiobacteraeota bacterium]MBV8365691.1 esterase [Candidatus Eremiobacteraeota bacterium]